MKLNNFKDYCNSLNEQTRNGSVPQKPARPNRIKTEVDVSIDDYKKNTIASDEYGKKMTAIDNEILNIKKEFIGEEVRFRLKLAGGKEAFIGALEIDKIFFREAGPGASMGAITIIASEFTETVSKKKITSNWVWLKGGKFIDLTKMAGNRRYVYNGDLAKLLLSKKAKILALLSDKARIKNLTVVDKDIKFQASVDTGTDDEGSMMA